MRAGSIVLFGMYGSVSDADLDRSRQRAAVPELRASPGPARACSTGVRSLPMYLRGRAGGRGSSSPICRAFAGDLELRFLLASGIITTYTWLTAYEFWRGRSEPLVSRWPAIFMLFAHGSLFLLRTPLFAMLPWSPTERGDSSSVWLTVLSFEALLFTIAIAFILLAMAKERTEFRHRTAAMVDPLTGIANRRSFLQDGTELAKRHAPIRCSTARAADRSRSLQVDQRPLRPRRSATACCRCSPKPRRANSRSTDLIGRLGGEEFAAVLYNVSREKAVALAERIRSAFAEAAGEVDGRPVGATVSIGVVVSGRTPRSTCRRTARAGRSGALLRQGARPQPRRGRHARPRPAAARTRCRAGRSARPPRPPPDGLFGLLDPRQRCRARRRRSAPRLLRPWRHPSAPACRSG